MPRPLAAAALVMLAAAARADNSPVPVWTAADALRAVQEARGKAVVFHLWGTWCPPCRAEMPELNKIPTLFPRDEVRFLALATGDTPEKVGGYLAAVAPNLKGVVLEEDPNFDRLLAEAGMAYEGGVPFTAVFDRDGNLVDQWTGGRRLDDYVAAIRAALETDPAARQAKKDELHRREVFEQRVILALIAVAVVAYAAYALFGKKFHTTP